MARREFKYDILNNFGEVDNDGKFSLSLIEVSWQGRKPVLDLRRIDEDGNVSKGVSFFHEEGLENLVYLAIEQGLCDTDKVRDIIDNPIKSKEGKSWYEPGDVPATGRKYDPIFKVIDDEDLLS